MARPTDKGLIAKAKLTAIGAALRKLFGGTKQYTPDEMAAAINGIEKKTSSNLTVSGRTVTVPAGYYTATAEKSIPSGVANSEVVKGDVVTLMGGVRALEVTPYTNVTTDGYVEKQFKAGTKTRITASEIVDGTKDITSNGTYRVEDYKSVFVNVPQPIEWDTWVFNDDIGGDLSFPDMTLYFCVPMMLTDGRQVLGVEIYYYDTGSTDSAYMNYFIGGSATATRVYTYADYGSTNTWASDTYKTIKVPSYVRLFESATNADMGSPPYMYKRLYEFLSGAATLQ